MVNIGHGFNANIAGVKQCGTIVMWVLMHNGLLAYDGWGSPVMPGSNKYYQRISLVLYTWLCYSMQCAFHYYINSALCTNSGDVGQ